MALTKISTGMLKQDAASSDLNIDAGTLYLDVSNNRVGIANTSPSQALNITGNALATGWFRGAAGSASTPTFIVDGSTGMFRASSNDIGFSTAGSERVRIDSSGNVGIGTSTAGTLHSSNYGTTKLHIDGGSGRGQIILEGDANANLIMSDNGATANSRVFITQVTDGLLKFRSVNDNGTSKSNIMSLTSDGNVGIGTSSPSSALEVIGTDPNNNVSRVVNIKDDRSYAANVGGGISLFGKYNSSGNYSTFAQIIGAKTNGTDGDYSGYLAFKTRSASALPAERMRIDASGNVGIGVTPESYQEVYRALQVGNTALIGRNSGGTSEMYLTANSYYDGAWKYIVSDEASVISQSAGVISFHNAASGTADATISWSEAMRIDASGNLLVGKTAANNTSQGVTIYGSIAPGAASFVRDSGNTLVLNRLTNDGEIVAFRKDGTTVGSIGASVGDLYIQGPTSNHSGLRFDTNAVIPFRDNAIADNSINLGLSNVRFKDLYLSGNINLSAFAQINSSTAFYLDSDIIHFRRNNEAESARIDSSGNLLVGKTSTSTSVVGSAIYNYGTIGATRDGSHALDLGRNTSDGDIAVFRKDNSIVGSIGNNTDFYIASQDGTGLRFTTTQVLPCSESGAIQNGSRDLGSSSGRFKDLHLAGSVITGGNTANNFGSIDFKADSVRARIIGGYASGGGGYLKFHTDSTGGSDLERARIDNSGNLLVGKTNNTLSNDGTIIRTGGEILVTNTSDIVANFNRTGTDGSIVTLYKDGSTVGSIGTDGSNVYIGTDDTTLKMDAANNGIFPRGTNGAQRDGGIQLGSPGNRFSDLYLSGGVVFGTTGGNVTGATLDDYEEGTWTPTIVGDSGASGQSYNLQNGYYTKIGSFVHCTFDVQLSTLGTLSGTYVIIKGLPFSGLGGNLGGTANIGYNSGFGGSTQFPIGAYLSGSNVYLMEHGGSGSNYILISENLVGSSARLIGSILIRTS